MERKFTVSQLRPIRDNMTISRDAGLDSENTVTFFSLGANTSISQETYDVTAIYIGAAGTSAPFQTSAIPCGGTAPAGPASGKAR